MEVRRFDSGMLDDWLDFFDNRGFHDHSEWGGCYCTFFHYPKEKTCPVEVKTKREYAIWLLKNKIMDGYVVYDKKKIVGWCNVGRKSNYSKLKCKEDNNIAILCFLVEKKYRNKGITRMILKEIIKKAKEDNFEAIEAYPNFNPETEFSNYHGSVGMYLEEKFIEVKQNKKRKMILGLK